MHANAKKKPTLAEFIRHPFNPANNRMTRLFAMLVIAVIAAN